MTEKELIHRAKVFRANCESNGDKMSFSDSCKIVLLAAFIDGERTTSLVDESGERLFIVREDLVKIYWSLAKNMLVPRWLRWLF